MENLINLNIAYILIMAAVMLAITTILFPGSIWVKFGMVLCLAAAGFELFYFKANLWALVVVALSPLPIAIAVRYTEQHRPLLIIAIGMFIFGSVFLFVDKDGSPLVKLPVAPIIYVFCAEFIWIATTHVVKARGTRRGADPDSYVGLIGKAVTEIHDFGLVQVEEQTFSARSKDPIPAGSAVRILKDEGMVLVVKKVDNIIKRG